MSPAACAGVEAGVCLPQSHQPAGPRLEIHGHGARRLAVHRRGLALRQVREYDKLVFTFVHCMLRLYVKCMPQLKPPSCSIYGIPVLLFSQCGCFNAAPACYSCATFPVYFVHHSWRCEGCSPVQVRL